MIQLQILSKVLQTGSNAIIEDNLLTEDYFLGYEEEYKFIQEHLQTYGNVPDKATFLSKFPEFEFVEVAETDRYLVDTIREEFLYQKSVPVLQKMAELLKTDSNAAAEYLSAQMDVLRPSYGLGGTDIVARANDRFEAFRERKNNPKEWYFESGFPELDEITNGIQREEELFVIFARTNQGKSWILEKMCAHVWGLGFNVGYFSPEMSANSVGFRFDTLTNHYANRALMTGGSDIDEQTYQEYTTNLKQHNNRFMVATPKDFGNSLTVSKLKNWVRQYKLDLVAIDGIKYMTDERGRRGDNVTTSLTNISEDLMAMSVELGVPVLVVVQANRTGVVQDEDNGTPELESIRDSDGISHNASKVISIRQKKNNVLEIGIKKSRFGAVGGKLNYVWDINTGDFKFIPATDDAEPKERTRKKVDETSKKYKSSEDVF